MCMCMCMRMCAMCMCMAPAWRLVAASEGRYQPSAGEDALRERIAEADDTSARLLSVVEQMSAEQPQYSSVLSTMVQAVLSARS